MTGRLMIAAPSSGAGKTTVVCGLLRALADRGEAVTAFKCGPDYIDPMFHTQVLGVRSRNLDLFLLSKAALRYLLCKNAGEGLALLEGAMGYYDGIGCTEEASAYAVAQATGTPVVLIIDGRGAALSLAAQVHGFAAFRPDSRVAGVILNRVSAARFPALQRALEQALGLPVLGYLPYLESCRLESRHLGLVTAAEVSNLRQKMACLSETLRQTVDFTRLLQIARSAGPLSGPSPSLPEPVPGEPVLALAQDAACSFYYQDSLDLLAALGARLIPFSPLTDAALPKGASGLLLGGGYPELYAAQLAANRPLLGQLRAAVGQGMPCVAECGGFMLLQQAITDAQGRRFALAGALPGECERQAGLRRFGYLTLQARQDSLLLAAGERLPAHEFHYWDSTACGADYLACKASDGSTWRCVVAGPTLYAGYPHLHFYSHPQAAQRLLRACVQFRRGGASR